MKFQSFKFPEIRPTIFQKCLIDSGWLSYHINTELKAKAAIYHYEILMSRYDDYFKNQPIEEAQSILFFEHPLKEIIFFEFVAVTSNLYSCFDSLLQEINCAYRLNLSPTQKRGQSHVTLNNIKDRIKSKYNENSILLKLEKLSDKKSTEYEWLSFLKIMRNTALHADIYSTSHETRDIKRILKLGFETKVDKNDKKTIEAISKQMQKRDIVISVDGNDFFMVGLTEFLKKKMIEFVEKLHNLMICDRNIGKR